jgi:hypothetical protein
LGPQTRAHEEKADSWADYAAEEPEPPVLMPEAEDKGSSGSIFANQSPDKMEQVLNSGMEFLGGLLEMATGQKMTKSLDQEKILTIDRKTGEVTMKFKLPGW